MCTVDRRLTDGTAETLQRQPIQCQSGSATHVSRAILAIITYVRTSYFKGTSQISEVLWKYFGSDEVLLKYVMYLLLLKYKIAISVSNPSISTMTSGMLFISILYSLFILYSSAHLCRQPSVSRRHPAASGHGHGHGGWRRVHGGYALAEASASASAAVTSRSRTHHYHSQSLSHTHTPHHHHPYTDLCLSPSYAK